LLPQIPSFANWYFIKVQNLDFDGMRYAKYMVLVMAVHPFLQSLRGYIEGLAALRRRPNAILAGQGVFLATMVIALFVFLESKIIPSYMMGGIAILFGIIMTIITIRIGLIWTDLDDHYGISVKSPTFPDESGPK